MANRDEAAMLLSILGAEPFPGSDPLPMVVAAKSVVVDLRVVGIILTIAVFIAVAAIVRRSEPWSQALMAAAAVAGLAFMIITVI